MTKDAMTPIERAESYAKGELIDRLPCVPIIGNTAARVIGVKVRDFRGNGKLIAKAQIESYRLFGYDNIRVFTDLYVMGEAMGAKVFYPEDETAYLESPAIDDIKNIGKIKIADPYKDGNLPHHLEALRIVLEAVGREVPVGSALVGPFTNASFLIGAETLTKLIIRDPESVHRLCELSLESSLRYADAIIEAGGTPSLTDAMSSSTVISPKHFKEFSFPYIKKLVDHISLKGRKVTLHICGKTSPIWDIMADTGAACLSIDNDADLLEAKKRVGTRVKLMGNIKPSETMLQGTEGDVRRAVLSCVHQAYDNPKGYIVASGCSLPTETPFKNITAMLNIVREIGYPVKEDRLPELGMQSFENRRRRNETVDKRK